MDSYKVRVNGAMLGQNVEQAIVLAGEVLEERDGGSLVMKASDGVSVTVSFETPVADLSRFVEVTGKVREDLSVEGWITTNIGDNFDLGVYNDAVSLMQKFPQPFHV